MRIVVDLGCRDLGGVDSSMGYLIDEYRPTLLFGFDPNAPETVHVIDETFVLISQKVAWTHDREVAIAGETYRAHVSPDNRGDLRSCFDFSSWLKALPACHLIVKMNIEGGEYPLLRHMHEQGTDELVDLLIVQWHEGEKANGWDAEGRPEVRCEVQEWHGACV